MLDRYDDTVDSVDDALRLKDLASLLEDQGWDDLAVTAERRYDRIDPVHRGLARLLAPVYNPGWRRPEWRDRMAPFGARMAERRAYRSGDDGCDGGTR